MSKAEIAYRYGWSLESINKLTVSEFNSYLEAARRIEATDLLKKLNVQDYSRNMKAEGRKKLFTYLHKTAYPDRLKKGIKFSDFARTQKEWQTKE